MCAHTAPLSLTSRLTLCGVRDSLPVYDKIVYDVGSTIKSLDISLPAPAQRHIVNIKTNGYGVIVVQGEPVILYTMTFLGDGVAQATAGDPCDATSGHVSSCRMSNSWDNMHACAPMHPPPAPPPCGGPDCTCACCSNGRCLDASEASFLAGNAASCSHRRSFQPLPRHALATGLW